MATPNPLKGFQISRDDLQFVGKDLQRPECILAERDGTLWSADARGGVMRIEPDGNQRLIAQQADSHFAGTTDLAKRFTEGTLPNGLAFARNGDILISNFGTDRLEVMTREGGSRVLYDSIDGKPIGKVNFVLRDSKDRIWLTVSTRIKNWMEAIRPGLDDGFIALADERGLRIVADGLHFTNEVRLDAKEEYLYAVETCGRRITRFRVGGDGSLSGREIFGPRDFGPAGFPDGCAFDDYGNLWVTLVMAERLIALTPDGEMLTLFDDGKPDKIAALEAGYQTGRPAPEQMMETRSSVTPWIASVTFGGPDLRNAYIGTLFGTNIPWFRSPVAGLPMVHWSEK
ncbi:SMP-30/gluconolactonase/LRE family protein [Ferrovibrio terrae]|uniref:SMP-30/gluconolactonase/LRE family protein n=1 Tax=Ferrovibrio terrae TaxID=2594003 RepID=A0A516H2Q1_9PROT|nr:SMP-30/gluconolactonase/LRE family protein [Ferrovibrio terrae]QDO98063.1 SMP-30/gluconolactonase/LRE family protein [Ferrovibrio terrae]